MTALTVCLPFPTVAMGSNSNVHWSSRAQLRAQARRDGKLLALAALDGAGVPFKRDDKLRALVTFCPPTKRRRDLDNCFSGIKAGLDGVFEALNVDDSQLGLVTLQWGDVTAGGRVEVTLMPGSGR